MMVEKEEHLGLSLSLSFPHHQRKLNNVPSSSSSFNVNVLQKPTWSEALFHASPSPNTTATTMDRSTDNCRGETTRSFLRGIDVNLLPPTTADCGGAGDDYAGVSSPNSTVSSVSGKRSERSSDQIAADDENDNENELSRGISDEEDGETSRKKLRLSKDQSAVLEESFKEHNTLNPKQKLALAKQLGLRPRQVEVWFQNRRARTKLKQTEVDCEFLKRCCENLTEENRRLQKEVQELRALKLSPQFYMQMTPPTTLTMCPSCERVAVPAERVAHHSRPIPTGLWRGPTTASIQPRP